MNSNKLLPLAVELLCACFTTQEEGVAAAIDLAVLVAASDGRIDADEMAALSVSLEAGTKTKFAPTFVRHLVAVSRQQMAASGVSAHAKQMGERFAAQNCVDEALRVALLIAMASDGLARVEREHIELVANAAGAPSDRVDVLLRELEAKQND